MTNDYPEYWPLVAVLIKALASWRCEHCGRPHDPPSGYTLTVHHLDGDKANCTYTNLVALCQRCHLRIQAAYLPGQLFFGDAPAWARVRGLDKPWDVQAREMIDFATGLLTPAQFERRYGSKGVGSKGAGHSRRSPFGD